MLFITIYATDLTFTQHANLSINELTMHVENSITEVKETAHKINQYLGKAICRNKPRVKSPPKPQPEEKSLTKKGSELFKRSWQKIMN